jgi:hypothetical protein
MQLDLFSDNRNVMLQNDVVAALRRRDQIAGRDMLTILSAEYPRDSLLMPLDALLNTQSVRGTLSPGCCVSWRPWRLGGSNCSF